MKSPLIALLLAVAPLATPIAPAEVRSITLSKLAVQSELIVVAQVNKLVVRTEGTFASATPLECWNGVAKGDIEFIVSSTFVCDISKAVPGERVVLFLSAGDSGRLSITHYGRGRMPLVTLAGRDIATYWGGVILPEGAPVVTVSKSGGPYSKGVELGEFKRLVLAALEAAKHAEPTGGAK